MDEKSYDDIFRYPRHEYCEGATKNEKRRIPEKAQSFKVVEYLLYHKGYKGKMQRVVKPPEVQELVKEMHGAVVGGCHFGQNATQQKSSEKFWWPTMTEDVRI